MSQGIQLFLFIFASSFLVGLSGAMSPGPLLAYSVREAGRWGFVAGPLVSLGHAVLELLVVVLLALGLSHFLEQELVVGSIGLGGGLFLVWLGYRMVRHPGIGGIPKVYPSNPDQVGTSTKAFSVLGGALVSLSNPFWFLWWATIGAAYLVRSLESLGGVGVASFYGGHISSDFAWYSLVALGIAKGRRYVTDKVYRGVMVACGLFLLGLGVFFLQWAVRLLAG